MHNHQPSLRFLKAFCWLLPWGQAELWPLHRCSQLECDGVGWGYFSRICSQGANPLQAVNPKTCAENGYKPHGFVPKKGNQRVFKVRHNNIKLLNSSTITLGLPTMRPSLPDSPSLFL